MVIPRGNEQPWLRFVGKVERLRIGIFRRRLGGNRIKLPNIKFIVSKVNSIFCRKEDIFFGTIGIASIYEN